MVRPRWADFIFLFNVSSCDVWIMLVSVGHTNEKLVDSLYLPFCGKENRWQNHAENGQSISNETWIFVYSKLEETFSVAQLYREP